MASCCEWLSLQVVRGTSNGIHLMIVEKSVSTLSCFITIYLFYVDAP